MTPGKKGLVTTRNGFLATVLLGAAAMLHGGVIWSPAGPPGGDLEFVASAASRPETVYVSSIGGGVLASDDAGGTWRFANSGLSSLQIECLAVSPSDPRIVYAGAIAGGFVSTDAGASWLPLGGGFPPSEIDTIAIDPAKPSNVYAAGIGGALVRSHDAGATWTSIATTSTAAAQPRLLAVDPSNPSNLYLATLAGGVFRSSDAGDSWTASTVGLTDTQGNVFAVAALAVDPASPAHLLAGTSEGIGTNSGVFASTDSGATWTASNDGAGTAPVSGILFGADGSASMAQQIGGVFTRAPGATAWSLELGTPQYINALAFGPGTPAALYAAFGNSPGGGLGFVVNGATVLRAVPALAVPALAADPATAGRVLAATSLGAYEYAAGTPGNSWTALALDNGFSVTPLAPASILFDTRTSGLVYYGTAGQVEVSIDGGRTIAYTGLVGDIFKPPLPVRSLVAQPGTTRGVYAGTTLGLFVSADGVIWTAGSADLAARQILTFTYDPASTTLWAGTDNGAYRSTDAGAHWTRSGIALVGSTYAVLVPGAAPGRIFAGGDAGLFTSTDGGTTWTPVGGVAVPVRALDEDAASGVLTAGTLQGIFVSADGGATWSAENGGLGNTQVLSLVSFGGALFAGTDGGSVFERIEMAERAPIARPEAPEIARPVAPRP
jgi:photosystem II stability/assembly factor-like uncharacterized protein